MKVLVVDDDPDILEAVNICFALRWEDAELFEAPDGATAIKRFREHNPDVVILDLNLPDIDGFEVCRTIRETSDVPVIMLTARGGEVDKVKGLEMGADDYITKPFRLDILLARLRAHLRQHEVAIRTIGPYTFRPSVKRLIHNETGTKISLSKRVYRTRFPGHKVVMRRA